VVVFVVFFFLELNEQVPMQKHIFVAVYCGKMY